MRQTLIGCAEHDRIIGLCRDNSLDVAWNVADQVIGDGNNGNDSRSCNEHQETISICRRSITPKLSSRFLLSNILSFVLLVVMGCFRAQGFSSFTTMNDVTRFEKLRHWKSPSTIRKQERYQRNRKRSEATASILFSKPSVVEQEEATISLEWMEYFSPRAEGTSDQQETPVLFLHGLLGSKRNFASCANMLAVQLDKKRRILGVDLRNHGNTQPWSEESKWSQNIFVAFKGYTIVTPIISFFVSIYLFLILNILRSYCEVSYPSMAEDVVNFLTSQNIKNVILVGHSMGGKVAQALALLYPEYVEGLVVLDIAPVKYSREEDPHWRAVEDILRAVHRVIEEAGSETTKREIDLSLRKSIPDPALRAFVLTNFDSRKNEWKIPIATMVQELEQIAGFDLTPDYDSSMKYEGDVFIINGGQSRFVRHSYMDQIASYFPNHMLTTIRGSGHWVHAEAPEDLVALLKRYLDR